MTAAASRPASPVVGQGNFTVYEGEADTITVAIKKPQGGQLTANHKTHDKAHNSKRAVGERGNSLPKTSFTALRNASLHP